MFTYTMESISCYPTTEIEYSKYAVFYLDTLDMM